MATVDEEKEAALCMQYRDIQSPNYHTMTKPTKKNDLTIPEKNKLLDETAKLNKGLEEYYVLLAVKLVEVSETEAWREAGYDTWPSYYTQELGRERSTVSRLLTVGKYMKENMLHAGNIKSYKRLAQAISQNPGEDPQKVLAIAATWSSDDFKAQAKEECSHPDPAILCCPHCWATMAK